MDRETHYYFKGRRNIKINHCYQNMFKLTCDFVRTKETTTYTRWGRNVETCEDIDESGYEPMYYPSLVTLRVDLFSFLNKTFGTDYLVTDEMRAYADSFRGKLEDLYNIGIEEGWEFTKDGDFLHKYRYTGDGASLGLMRATYGTFGIDRWSKGEFIELADSLVELFEKDPLQMAKTAMQKHYGMLNECGVGHMEDPTYSDNATGEFFIPASGDTKISQTMLR